MSYAALQRVVSNPRALAAYEDEKTSAVGSTGALLRHGGNVSASKAARRNPTATPLSSREGGEHAPLKTSDLGAERQTSSSHSGSRSLRQRSRGSDVPASKRLILGTEHEATEVGSRLLSEGLSLARRGLTNSL